MTRLLRLLAALFALSLVLTACGDDDGGVTPSPPTTGAAMATSASRAPRSIPRN